MTVLRTVRSITSRVAVVVCTLTIAPLVAAAVPLPAAAQATSQGISIDGDPVTIAVGPGETAGVTYDWDGSVQVVLHVMSCSPETSDGPLALSILIGDPLQLSSTSHCHPVHFPRTLGPRTPQFASGNFVGVRNNTEALSMEVTLALVSSAPAITGQIAAGGDPVSFRLPPVAGADQRRAAWFSFEGIAGQQLRLEMRDCSPFAGQYALRLPDLNTQFVSCNLSTGVGWSGTLPTTGTYRFEFETNNTVIGLEMSARLVHSNLPQACRDSGVVPIALVHGFNGNVGDWSTIRPFLVSRLHNELRAAGVPIEAAEVCSDAFVRAIVVGPRDSSFANATVLGSEFTRFRNYVGSDLLDIIVHSKGGLDSRWATYFAPSAVRNIMMIATPNGGTPLADIACGLYNSPFAVAQNQMESRFGPCDGPEDALYGLTESFVRDELNRRVLDQPHIVYQTIAGEAPCIWCQVIHTFMGPNDGLVPASSVRWLADSRGHTPVGVFPFEHGDLLVNLGVARRSYCSLSGRQHDRDACLLEPDQAEIGPAAEAEVSSAATTLAHFATLEVSAGGQATTTLPVGGIGPAEVAILTNSEDISAQAGGIFFEIETDPGGSVLAAQVDSPVDVELEVANAGAGAAELLVLVFAEGADSLQVDVAPRVVGSGEPVEVRVPGVTSVADISGRVIGPTGGQTALAFSMDGSDAVATVVSSVPGSHAVSVVQTGSAQRVAFDRFTVTTGTVAVPGSFTESVTTGSGGLGEALHLDVDVEVAEVGRYVLTGALVAGDGSVVAMAEAAEDLAAGDHQLRLTVSGPNVYASGQDGPYELMDLTLFREQSNGGRSVEAHRPQANSPTQPYQSDTFQPTLITPGFAVVEQGEFDATIADIPVALSEPVTRPVIVDYQSVVPSGDGYAIPGEDYEPVAGSLLFLPGETSKTIPVIVYGNPDQDEDLLAAVHFANPNNAAIDGDGQGGVWIVVDQ